jgi:ADP-heptose:LPS heptosyltransferase
LGSTSKQLLDICLRGEAWSSALLDCAIEEDDGRALLSIVVERLGDLFEPRLVETYNRLFREVIERVAPELRTRLRTANVAAQAPVSAKRVYVLSRVTLGADVAVTSVMLDAAKRKYPDAEIVFVGPRKSYEMFEADPRITHRDAPYARGGSLRDRLEASARLWFDVIHEDGIVIDPDSRLTQLGLISVCDESRYFFFCSRSFEAEGNQRLPEITARWVRSVFSVDAKPYVAPLALEGEPAEVTVSLGVGENPAKRLGDDFERELMEMLGGCSVLIDKGGSDEERARVERAIRPSMRTHDGSFAHFAAEIARSKLYIGYDSAGGHVASSCGVPVISIFTGAVSERFLERWKPIGTVVRGEDPDVRTHVRHAISEAKRRF